LGDRNILVKNRNFGQNQNCSQNDFWLKNEILGKERENFEIYGHKSKFW